MAIQDLKTSLDLKQDLNIYLKCKQFDNLNLILSIFDNSLQADLTNYDVRLRAMKADNVPLIQEHIGITKSGNVVNIQADTQLTTTAGNTPVELQFIDKSTGEKKATFNLVLVVVASAIAIEASISKATYTLLEELEKKLDQLSDFFEHIGEAIEANTNLENTIANSETAKNNLDSSILAGNTLKESLNNIISTGSTLKTNLENEISIGNTLKGDLEETISTGDNLLSSLETFEQEHADVTDISNKLANVNADLSENTQKLASNLFLTTNNIDDSTLIQAFIDTNQNIIFPPSKTFYLAKTINIPVDRYIDFNNCTFVPTGEISDFTNGFMFLVNSLDGLAWNVVYPGYVNRFYNINFDNLTNRIIGIKGFFVASSVDICNLKSNMMYQDILIDGHYLDGINIEKVFITNHMGDGYSIAQKNTASSMSAQGDAWHISKLQIEAGGAVGANRNLLWLEGANFNATIDGVINGVIYLANGCFNLKNCHIEVGNITIKNARVNLYDSILYHVATNGSAPLTLLTDNGVSKTVKLKNVYFTYFFWRDDNGITKGSYNANILIDPLYNSPIHFSNCVQGILPMPKGGEQGLFISTTTGTGINHYVASSECIINSKSMLNNPFITSIAPNTTSYMKVSYNELLTRYDAYVNELRGILWKGNSGTYYYKIGILVDWDRKIGIYDANEFSIVVTNTDRKLVDISILDSYISQVNNVYLIIYRGTTSGSYTDRSIISLSDTSSHQYDDYNSIFLRPWVAVTAGPATALTNYNKVIKNVGDNTVICYGTAIPTIGTWNKGDRIINTNIATGQVKGWVCSVAGIPGNWISEGTY
ncbi:hypothetical protein [Clostridium beijerinckii]|uniref:hypothetical protein n=1 Tax=Clostridium beijerinckii TaxID=1520 RepID=UPI001570904A|nr:hypothetical protein [Clostridium beijerinckii]NRT74431.1 hypothetical protein [Clostridium beijerinckii]